MKKVILLILVLGVAILGGIVLKGNVSGIKGSKVSAILGSSTGQRLYKAELAIDEMWCASCAVGAEYNLKAIDGVVDAYVGFTDNLSGEGWVVYENGKVSEEQIVKAIEPYEATIVSDTLYTK